MFQKFKSKGVLSVYMLRYLTSAREILCTKTLQVYIAKDVCRVRPIEPSLLPHLLFSTALFVIEGGKWCL